MSLDSPATLHDSAMQRDLCSLEIVFVWSKLNQSCAQVDADAHGSLGEKFGVRGFPTIKFFGRGKSTASPEE